MRIIFYDDDKQVLVQLKKYLPEYFQTNHLPQPEYAGYASGEETITARSWRLYTASISEKTEGGGLGDPEFEPAQ